MPMLRTQITLPSKLRNKIDKDRLPKGESLSKYLRKAARIRLEKKRNEKEELEKLANEFIGCLDTSKHPEWSTRKKIIEWQRKIRREKGI